jgi:hypothetical protein
MPLGGLLTIGLITAGTQIYAAHKQASAAKDAAKQQEVATDKAIALRQPYVDTGTKAFTTLGSLMGLGGSPAGGGGGSGAPPPTQFGTQGVQGMPNGTIVDHSSPQMAGGGGAAMENPAQLANNPNASSYPGYTPHQDMTPGGTRLMRAPDGSTKSVPVEQIGFWTQQGATVVNNG